MSLKEAYREKLEKQFQEWDKKVDVLEAKADTMKADARLEYEKKLNEVRKQRRAVKSRLKEMQHAGEESWQHMRNEMDNAWTRFRDSVENAMDNLR